MDPATAKLALDPESRDRGCIPREVFSRVLARSHGGLSLGALVIPADPGQGEGTPHGRVAR